MFRFIVSIFIMLHGLVHLLYFGHSRRLFELQPKMIWSEGSWAFSNIPGNDTTGLLAGISCILAAIYLSNHSLCITAWEILLLGPSPLATLTDTLPSSA